MTFHDIFYQYLLPTLLTVLSLFIGTLSKIAITYIKSKFKQLNHFKGDSIVEEAIIQAIDEMEDEVSKSLADGKLSDTEIQNIKKRASNIAETKLKKLYGFYKSDLIGWINERVDIALPKFISPKIKAFISKNL